MTKLETHDRFTVQCKTDEGWVGDDLEETELSHGPEKDELVTVIGHEFDHKGILWYDLLEYPLFKGTGWEAIAFQRFPKKI